MVEEHVSSLVAGEENNQVPDDASKSAPWKSAHVIFGGADEWPSGTPIVPCSLRRIRRLEGAPLALSLDAGTPRLEECVLVSVAPFPSVRFPGVAETVSQVYRSAKGRSYTFVSSAQSVLLASSVVHVAMLIRLSCRGKENAKLTFDVLDHQRLLGDFPESREPSLRDHPCGRLEGGMLLVEAHQQRYEHKEG